MVLKHVRTTLNNPNALDVLVKIDNKKLKSVILKKKKKAEVVNC